ncbi:MAG: hypothetical protein V1807_01095, partial [Patescibacteria group bacterium]
ILPTKGWELKTILTALHENNIAYSQIPKEASVIMTSRPFEEFLDGKSVVVNMDKFKDYRAQVSALCKFIDDIEKEKFPQTTIKKELRENRNNLNSKKNLIPNKFIISVKDREIWINDYLISKPHATGTNFAFFEYIQTQSADTKIERRKLPDTLKQEVGKKRFVSMLNSLGFTGEITKAFFYKISEHTLFYRGNKIEKESLEKEGIKIPLFLKELEVVHMRKSRPI